MLCISSFFIYIDYKNSDNDSSWFVIIFLTWVSNWATFHSFVICHKKFIQVAFSKITKYVVSWQIWQGFLNFHVMVRAILQCTNFMNESQWIFKPDINFNGNDFKRSWFIFNLSKFYRLLVFFLLVLALTSQQFALDVVAISVCIHR